jgi:hypothetical protein
MNKAAEMFFSDKVNKVFNIGTFITLVAGMAALMFNFFTMKSDIDLSINSLQSADVRIENKFDNEIYDLEAADIELKQTDTEIILVQKEDRAVVLEVRTGIAGIQTDLKWLISATKSNQTE